LDPAVIFKQGLGEPTGQFLIAAAGLALVGFWSATHFQNSIVAVIATLVFVPLLFIPGIAAYSLVRSLDGIQQEFLTFLAVRRHLPPDEFLTVITPEWLALAIGVPVALILLFQSLRQFRRIQMRRYTLVKHCAIIFVITYAICAWFADFETSAQHVGDAKLLRSEIGRSITALPPQFRVESDTSTQEVPLQRLLGTGKLSPQYGEWLRGSTITVLGPNY
jgi:hypothetical protein